MKLHRCLVILALSLTLIDSAGAGIFGRLRCRIRARRATCNTRCYTPCPPQDCCRTTTDCDGKACPKTEVAIHKIDGEVVYVTYLGEECEDTTKKVSIDLPGRSLYGDCTMPCTNCVDLDKKGDALTHLHKDVCNLSAMGCTTELVNGAVYSLDPVVVQCTDSMMMTRYVKLLTIRYQTHTIRIGYEVGPVSMAPMASFDFGAQEANCIGVSYGDQTYNVILGSLAAAEK